MRFLVLCPLGVAALVMKRERNALLVHQLLQTLEQFRAGRLDMCRHGLPYRYRLDRDWQEIRRPQD